MTVKNQHHYLLSRKRVLWLLLLTVSAVGLYRFGLFSPSAIANSNPNAILSLATANAANATTDWPQWRGPNRDGLSTETGLLTQWNNRTPELVWKADGLGGGYSTVAVVGNSIFCTGRQKNNAYVVCLNRENGRPVWKKNLGPTVDIPRSSPTVADDRLYVLFPDGQLACLRASDGKLLWRRHFVDDFGGKMMSGWKYSESLLIDGNKLVCTPGGSDATLVALNKNTGKLIWKSRVPSFGSRGRSGAGYSSIVVSTAAGVRQYVQLLGRGVVGVAADDGRFLWGYGRVANGTANVPTPLIHDDLVFCSSGYGTGSALLKLSKQGTKGVNAQEVYFLNGSQFQNHHGGVVLVGDYVFGGHGNNGGAPTCIELSSGKIVWKQRGPGSGSAAIVFADGHLYFRYQNGVMALIEANPNNYKLKGSFKIPNAGGDSWAHPVVAGGRLYLREKETLFVYDVSAR